MKVFPLALAVAALAAAVFVFRRGRRWSAVALAVFAAGAAFYGSGLVDIPSLESILNSLSSRLGAWTYLLVGTLAFLETSAFIGLVAPGEVAVVFGGFVAGQGKINPIAIGLLVWVCAAAGDSAGYLLGRRLGRGWALKYGPRVGVTESRFELVERFFTRHGGKTIVIGRFIGFVRALAPFIAGASRLPYLRFLPASVVGAGLWTAAFVTLGYVSGRSLHRAIQIAKQGNIGIFLLLVLVALGVGGYRLARRPTTRARVRSELTKLIGRETMEDLEAARKND